jgi:hypothetical protein
MCKCSRPPHEEGNLEVILVLDDQNFVIRQDGVSGKHPMADFGIAPYEEGNWNSVKYLLPVK